MRARMAVAVSGRKVRLREILLRDKPEEMLAASPKGTVPVLVLGDNTVIDESLAVMRWALDRHDPEEWLDPENGGLDDMLSLIERNDGPFKHHLDRYKYSTRYEGSDREAHRREGAAFLHALDARLSAGFLFGQRRALADVAIFPFVRQFRIADPDWFDAQDFCALQEWLASHLDWPVFQDAMAKHPLWKETGVEPAFPAA